jgi:hypothetical protein
MEYSTPLSQSGRAFASNHELAHAKYYATMHPQPGFPGGYEDVLRKSPVEIKIPLDNSESRVKIRVDTDANSDLMDDCTFESWDEVVDNVITAQTEVGRQRTRAAAKAEHEYFKGKPAEEYEEYALIKAALHEWCEEKPDVHAYAFISQSQQRMANLAVFSAPRCIRVLADSQYTHKTTKQRLWHFEAILRNQAYFSSLFYHHIEEYEKALISIEWKCKVQVPHPDYFRNRISVALAYRDKGLRHLWMFADGLLEVLLFCTECVEPGEFEPLDNFSL